MMGRTRGLRYWGKSEMTSKLKLCVVGCGRVSGSHLASLAEIPDEIELAAVVSRDADKGREFAARYGANRAYRTLEEALADPEIEAFDLCLPNHLHRDAAIRCAGAGKHVLVEKPMANTVLECEEMVRAADAAGVRLMVGQSRRFYEAVFESKRLVDAGAIGELFSITALLFAYLKQPPTDWWRSKDKTGGLMIPIWGSHIIDYVVWLFGGPPERVCCEAYSNNPAWEGEDETTILMGYANHRHATLKMSWNTILRPSEEEWDGKGKMLSSSDIVYERRLQGSTGSLHLNDETCLSLNGKVLVEGKPAMSNFAWQLREFASAIREGREPLCAGRRIVDVIRVQEAALASASSGEVVRI